MDRRGALLGPEGSGPAHRTLVLGVGSVSSRVTARSSLVGCGGWGRPSANRCEGFLSGCVVSLGGEFFVVGVGLWLVFLPVF